MKRLTWIIIAVLALLLIIIFAIQVINNKAISTAREKLISDILGYGSAAHAWYRMSAMLGGGGGEYAEDESEYIITSDVISAIISHIDSSAEGHVIVNDNGTYEFYAEGNRLIIRGRSKFDAKVASSGEVVLGVSPDDPAFEKVMMVPVE